MAVEKKSNSDVKDYGTMKSKSESKSKAEGGAKSESKAGSKSGASSGSKASSKDDSKPSAKDSTKDSAKNSSKDGSKAESKPASKSESKTESKASSAKTSAKTDSKAGSKESPKNSPKAGAKETPKAESKAESKGTSKSESKPAASSKSDAKPDAKADSKPATSAKTDARTPQNSRDTRDARDPQNSREPRESRVSVKYEKRARKDAEPKKPVPLKILILRYAIIAVVLLTFSAVRFFRPDIWDTAVCAVDDVLWAMGVKMEIVVSETPEDIQDGLGITVKFVPDELLVAPSDFTPSSSGSSKPLTDENLALYFGNPTGATVEVKNAKNYLVEKVQFTMSYNAETLIPNWVMWHLAKDDVGSAERGNDFRPDEDLPEGFYAVKKADYQYMKYGFDRGHVCPSADRTASSKDNSITFLMTNMIPQSPNCNRNVWKNLEAYERSLALDGNELYIAAGPWGRGGTSDRGTFESINLKNGKKIEVPSYCWKIIMILPEGSDDFSRVRSDTKVLAAFIPNDQKCAEKNWSDYITTVDFIEDKTETDFFAVLADDIEDAIESCIYRTK